MNSPDPQPDQPTLIPYRIGRFDTNETLPLACGHKHVLGDTVYDAGTETVCARCAEEETR